MSVENNNKLLYKKENIVDDTIEFIETTIEEFSELVKGLKEVDEGMWKYKNIRYSVILFPDNTINVLSMYQWFDDETENYLIDNYDFEYEFLMNMYEQSITDKIDSVTDDLDDDIVISNNMVNSGIKKEFNLKNKPLYIDLSNYKKIVLN